MARTYMVGGAVRDELMGLPVKDRDRVVVGSTEEDMLSAGYTRVTLEEDLQRRDLTINAIARDEAGSIIDPYGGVEDLQRKVLRHVSEAFREDPVRILRIARFSARYADFTIAPETLDLMRGMVAAGEVDALVSERVWQEIAKGLMEQRPSRITRKRTPSYTS